MRDVPRRNCRDFVKGKHQHNKYCHEQPPVGSKHSTQEQRTESSDVTRVGIDTAQAPTSLVGKQTPVHVLLPRSNVRIGNVSECFTEPYKEAANHEHEVQNLKQWVGLPCQVVPEFLELFHSPRTNQAGNNLYGQLGDPDHQKLANRRAGWECACNEHDDGERHDQQRSCSPHRSSVNCVN